MQVEGKGKMGKDILILTPFYSPNIGGAETFVEALVNEIVKDHIVDVLTFQPFNGHAKDIETLSSTSYIHRMKWKIKHGKSWQGVGFKNFLSVFPKIFFGALKLNHKYSYDIIHAQGLISGLAAVILKRIFKCKAHITLLALYDFKGNFLVKYISRKVLSNADAVFVEGNNGLLNVWDCFSVDDYMKDDLLNIKLFNHWCDHKIFYPINIERDSSLPIKVLFIGRPTREKGRHIIEEAEKIINNKNKYQFIYVENTPYAELPKLYQMADIVVVPSLYPEGYSRVVIEAASCGCALIVSNYGSLPEMVKGWAIACDPTPLNFAYQIQKIHLNEARKQAYDYAKKNFSVKNAEVFLNEYK